MHYSCPQTLSKYKVHLCMFSTTEWRVIMVQKFARWPYYLVNSFWAVRYSSTSYLLLIIIITIIYRITAQISAPFFFFFFPSVFVGPFNVCSHSNPSSHVFVSSLNITLCTPAPWSTKSPHIWYCSHSILTRSPCWSGTHIYMSAVLSASYSHPYFGQFFFLVCR